METRTLNSRFAAARRRMQDRFANRGCQGKKSSHHIHFNRIYALALAVCIAFLIFGLVFVFYAAGLSRAETIVYVQAATNQTKIAIEEHINEEFDRLMTAADIMKGDAPHDHDDHIDALADVLGSHNAYVVVGHADANGQAVWIDRYGRRHSGDLSPEPYITSTLAGENTLSGQYYEPVSDLDVHYYAVPIYDRDVHEVTGVLFAADPQDELRRIIDNSLYAGVGLAHIIDEQGDFVVRSNSPIAIATGGNIFDVDSVLSTDAQQAILEDFASRRPGHLEKAFPGERRLAAYAPLAVNDWYVFYAVPEDRVNAELRTIMGGAAVILTIATGVFVFLFLLIRQTNNKNRKALEQLAFEDPITGQRNYHKFLLDAEEILKNANGASYAICYCDIKGFRYLKDMFGRDVGDRLLRYMAEFFQRVSQKGEICCRLGEDNFVSLRALKSKQEIEQRFESAAQYAAVFPEIFSCGYKPELYGGAYILDAADGPLTLNDMMDRAIAAHDEAKFSGGSNRLCVYTNEMREQKLWETEVESKMESALENNEFKVYLQPKIDIQHGNRVLGAEALVRWESDKGLVPPVRFIELFEKNGFILQLDRFVFETICRYYRENILDGNQPAVILSVNVSRLALMQSDFIRFYTAVKERYGIPDYCIELEFTESLALGDHELFKVVVAECRRSGFLCSMDDFGSGYSSLNMLKSIYVDILKLDRQFFLYEDDSERGRELVRTIILMAKALHMKTIAEGVDEEAQVEHLRAVGCDAIQGYVFSKPMPAEAFGDFLRLWRG